MSNKEEKALKEWQEQLEKEVQKLKDERLTNQIPITKRKLEILKAMENTIKGDPHAKKVWKQEVTKLEQALEDKQMQSGRLFLLEKLTGYLEDVL